MKEVRSQQFRARGEGKISVFHSFSKKPLKAYKGPIVIDSGSKDYGPPPNFRTRTM